jgi:hypothetical protein
MAVAQPKKMNWWYQSIIEWMIENPDLPLRQCSIDMGVTQSWLSCIINSDAFRLAYAEARGEHFEATSHHVIKKMEGVAMQAADLISERLEEHGDEIPINQLNSTAELALKALGYASSHGNKPQSINLSVSNELGVRVSVDRDTLALSRERMRQLSSPASALPRPVRSDGPDSLESAEELTIDSEPGKVPTTS